MQRQSSSTEVLFSDRSDHLALSPPAQEFIDSPESLEQLFACILPPCDSSKWPFEFSPSFSWLSISSDFGTCRYNSFIQIILLRSTFIGNSDYNADNEKKKDKTLHLLNGGVKPN